MALRDGRITTFLIVSILTITAVTRREERSDSKMPSGSVLPIRQRFHNEALTQASVGSLSSFVGNHNSLQIMLLWKAFVLARDSLPAAEPQAVLFARVRSRS